MAWWIPSASPPGTGRPRATVEPPASMIASNSARSSAAVTSVPAVTPQLNSVPSARIWVSRRSRCRFSILNSGMPKRSRPPGCLGPLEHGDVVPGPGQLLGRGQAGRPGADDRDLLARAHQRRLGLDPAFGPGPVDDLHLDLLDRDRVGVDAEHAGGLARRRAEPAGELGEVVGRVQPFGRLVPVVPPDQVVPLRDQVAQRAAGVAERDAAVHAAAGLALQAPGREVVVDLAPVPDPHVHRPAGRGLARGGQKSLGIGHRALVLCFVGDAIVLGGPGAVGGSRTWAAATRTATAQACVMVSRARRT